MTEAEQRVRDMLSEEKISAEDAERLLDALRADSNEEERGTGTAEGPPEVLDQLGGAWAEEIEEDVRERIASALDTEDVASTGDDTFEVGGEPHLVVRGFNGRVRVIAGEPGSIHVRAKLKNREAVEYRAVQEADLVKVEARPARGSSGFLSGFFGQRRGADIEVTAPVATRLDLATSNGLMEIRGIESDAALQTSNAPIRVEKFKGDMEARTSNGPIKIQGFQGSAELATSNGRVSVDDGYGRFDAQTSNGSIGFRGEMEVSSSNRLTTSNGSIKVEQAGEPNLRLDASTVNGRVRCEMPGFAASVATPRRLEGVAGEGETDLMLKTVNGSITIR